jgi:hypothetical protein
MGLILNSFLPEAITLLLLNSKDFGVSSRLYIMIIKIEDSLG